MLLNILIGSDPEVMVKNSSGIIVPVTGLLGGCKEHPVPVNNGAVQEDNVNAEFNINPASTEQEFTSNIQVVMEILSSMLPPDFTLEVKSSHRFPKQLLMAAGAPVMKFGCSPDYNALTKQENDIPPSRQTLRTAGGHVHIGWDKPVEKDKWDVGIMCDYTLGLWSLLHDDDNERRRMYGKAGAVRVKDYGVEYRVLSNFWLKSPQLMREVFRRAKLSAKCVGKLGALSSSVSPQDVQTIINSGDKAEAVKALKMAKGVLHGL